MPSSVTVGLDVTPALISISDSAPYNFPPASEDLWEDWGLEPSDFWDVAGSSMSRMT
jgi:hypothetical protein